MEIQSIDGFLAYYARIRFRSEQVIAHIPEALLEWRPKPHKFSFGDLIRHIAGIERYLYAETVLGRPSRYPGHDAALAPGLEATLTYFRACHQESVALFATLSDAALQQKCTTPMGTPITVWKWLRALVEHEIHHRGQIYLMLGLLDVATPSLYGLTAEEVLARSKP